MNGCLQKCVTCQHELQTVSQTGKLPTSNAFRSRLHWVAFLELHFPPARVEQELSFLPDLCRVQVAYANDFVAVVDCEAIYDQLLDLP